MSNSEKLTIRSAPGIDRQALERLADILGICLYKVNLKTKDISLNLNTTRITGHDLTDLPNTEETKESMIIGEDRATVNNSVYSIISGQSDHYHVEYRMRRRDSSIVPINEAGIISEYAEDGKPLFMAAMALDMSRLQWAEEKARDIELEMKRLVEGREDRSLAEENRLLRAANAAATMVVGGFHQDYVTVLHQSLKMLGESVGANYAGIWRNVERDGAIHCFPKYHWTTRAHAAGDVANCRFFKYDDFLPGWKERLAEKRFIICDEKGLPEEFIDACGMTGARSVMLAPFYLHGDFWGMIGLTREESTPFTASEVEALMTGAVTIACTVSRNETLGKITLDREKAMANTLAKGEFLSRMSHEMRTPLNAIIGMTNIAIREKDPQKITEHLKKVEVSSHLLLNIINDVLDMSKIEAGKLEVVSEPFDFNAMLGNAANIVKVKMDEKHQRFTVNYGETMMNTVISDEHRLLQVIVNLLNNAMKFTPTSGEISLSAFQRKIDENRIKLRVEVQDSGIGLSLEQQRKLFNAFEQADGTITRKYGGTGLGLAICKQILNGLGGDIWVKSKPEQGACFFFELEADLGGPVSEFHARNVAQPSGGMKERVRDWSTRRIILADDVEINREIIEMTLGETGIGIDSAENGKEVIEKFSAEPNRYDLILMDVQMPVMDGLSATRQIRAMDNARAKEIPIIAMTANAFREDIDICISAGMNEHVAKPIAMDSFLGVMEKYLK